MRRALMLATPAAIALTVFAATQGTAAGSTPAPTPAAASAGAAFYTNAIRVGQTTPQAAVAAPARPRLNKPPLLRAQPAGTSAPRSAAQPVKVLTVTAATAPGVSNSAQVITHDQQVMFNGLNVAPPDTQIAVGPTASVEAVNVMAEIRDRATGAKTDFDLTAFFQLPVGFQFTDPRIVYDIAKGRWYMSGLAFNGAPNSDVLVAVSSSSDPHGSWTVYDVLSQTQRLCDQPHLGFSDDKIAVACDNFGPQGGQMWFFNDVWLVVDKGQAMAGANSVAESGRAYTDNLHFGIQPVYSATPTTTQYMIYNPPGTLNGGLIAVMGNPRIAAVGWAEANIAVASVNTPPRAPQMGNTTTIDSGDLRFNGAFYANGLIWTAGGDSCIPAGDSVQRACLRIVQADVNGWPFVHMPLGVTQDFDVAGNGKYFYYPAIAMDASGTTYVSYTESSSTDFPSVYASDILPGAQNAIDQTLLVMAGVGPYVGPPNPLGGGSRWGDYGAVAPDPLDPHAVWLAGEFAAFEGSHLDDWGTVSAVFSVPPCASAAITTAATQPGFPGPPIVFTGSSTGCWGTPQYQFRELTPNGASWKVVQPYSSNSTLTWDTSKETAVGTYTFQVMARSQGFVTAFDATATTTFNLQPGCGLSAITAAPPTSATTGTTVVLSATASGSNCTAPQFRFWIQPPGGAWTMVQDYSTTATYSWTNTAPTGTYHLGVHARNTGASLAYESVASIPFTIKPFQCTSVTVTAAPASPHPSGTQVTITGTATGCPNPVYEFWMLAQGSKSWQLVRGYSTSATFNWNSTGALAGTENFGIWVRDASSTAAYDAFASIPYTVTTPSCTSVTASASPASPSTHGTGVQVTITGVAAGCTNANPQYEFWMKAAGSSTWQLLRGYSTSATYTWNTTGALAGTEQFGVWVRDAGSPAAYDSYISITYTLT